MQVVAGRPRRTNALAGLAGMAALGALCLGACGSRGPTLTSPIHLPNATTATTTSTAPTAPSSPSTLPPPPPAAAVGTAVTVTGPGPATASVTVVTVTDPATPAYPFDAAGSGDRFVVVRLAVGDPGPAPLAESALADVTVTDSRGATDAPVITEMAGCPSFTGGVVSLAPNAPPLTGCVSFELPVGVSVRVVHVALGGVAAGGGSWAVA